MIHYKSMICTTLESLYYRFPAEREGYGSRLLAYGMDDDCSVSWSNIKLDKDYLLPSSQHQLLSFERHRKIRSDHGSSDVRMPISIMPSLLVLVRTVTRSDPFEHGR